MARSGADLAALKAEIVGDSANLGLVANHANDAQNAALLNAVRNSIQIYKDSLSTADVFNATVPAERDALSPAQSAWYSDFMAAGGGNFSPFRAVNVRTRLEELFPPNAQSNSAILATFFRDGNRIDQLFQAGALEVGGTVTASDCANALDLP